MRRLALPLALALVALTVMTLGPPARGAGPTYFSGEVVGSWTANGTPYIVTGEAFVPATGSLEIGPGVEVRFAAGASLVIHGGLTVRGSDLGPVAFTSNGSATPGAWGGLIVRGSAAIASASITYATSGVDVEGGSVQGDRLAVLSSRVGLRVNGSSSVVVGRSSFSLNEIAGVSLESAQVAMVRPELSNNGWALSLVSSELTIDNGTISGSAIGDADLAGSRVSLLNTTSSHLFQFHDIDSNVTERWYAHVRVADTFGSPVPMASVAVSGDALPVPLLRTTNPEGWAHWIDLAGRVTSTTGSIVPVYGVTAEARGSMASRTSTVVGDTLIPIALPADLTAPVAIAGPDLSATEDLTVSLDASRSTDNDPAFPLGATFTWRFDDAGTAQTLTGRTVPYVFATPGTYSVLLEVTDAAGNPGTDLLLVHVADVTLPVPRIAVPPEAYAGDTIVLDGLASTDNDPSFNETGNFTWTLESGSMTWTAYGRSTTFTGPRGDYALTLRVRDAGGNEALATSSFRLVPRPALDLVWLAAALAAWFAALGIAGTERGKMAFLSWLVLPLYTRMKKEEVLDQFTRGQIYGYIVVHPGDSYVDAKRNLQLNNGTLTHHLNVLERDGLIRSKNVGTRKLFFAAGARIPEDGGGMHEVQQQILRHLRETGGLAVNDVAGVIGISRQLAIYHLRDLSRQGLVRIERRAFRIVAYAEQPKAPPPPPTRVGP